MSSRAAFDPSAFERAYSALNDEQRQAVDNIDGPLLVVAGPGSGKTQLLSLRVANVLQKSDVYPSSILCLTFTDSAAVNMRQRLAGIMSSDAYKVHVHTFHSFALDIIDRYPEYFYNAAQLSIADELIQRDVLESIFSELDHDHPLASFHPDQGYVYLLDVKQHISHLKRAGLTAEQFTETIRANTDELEGINPIIAETFSDRISKKSFPVYEAAVQRLQKIATNSDARLSSLSAVVSESLQRAVSEALAVDSTGPISEWKKRFTKKTADKQLVLRDTAYTEKLLAMADIYEQYRKQLFELGYYDFDDMLIDTVAALKKYDELRYELQEQFLYVMVDEFQDTNDAQIQLLDQLVDNEVTESPNIMVVGDDDQAIYKFQGAEIKNIQQFTNKYPTAKVVTLQHNYRSTQDILDVAQVVIQENSQRLSSLLPSIEKQLVANVETLQESDIQHKTFETAQHEHAWVAEEISRLIKEGQDPTEIAIITRNHKELQEMVPYLQAQHVPVRYEQQQDVFTQPHIYQLIQLARFIVKLHRQDQAEVDELLPEILSYPFWELPREEVWSIAVRSKKERAHWIDCMKESTSERMQEIASWFQEMAASSEHEPATYCIDQIIAQLKPYYFSQHAFDTDTQEYVRFLSSLRVLIEAFREHQGSRFMRLRDVVRFVDLHQRNNIPLVDTSPFVNSSRAVQLLTAHKAKGLEFHTVFVLSSQEHIWMKVRRSSSLIMPLNLPIAPERDTIEDQLRLLYVALTRAKHRLYITSYTQQSNGREAERIRALQSFETDTADVTDHFEATQVLNQVWESYHIEPLQNADKALLEETVAEYTMSVTHLNNYLNVSAGGPQLFLQNNLLRFPQAKLPAGAYGSAIHSSIEWIYNSLKRDSALPEQDSVVNYFIEQLERQQLRKSDYRFFEKKGRDSIAAYFAHYKDSFSADHKIEVDFAKQGVVLDNAHLSGKIDKMILDEDAKTVQVVDFKTGKAFTEWKGKTAYDKIKLHNYKRQLMFYKLLVENSRDFSDYTANTGTLEFVEPQDDAIVSLEYHITPEDVERTTKLVQIVFRNITNLEFPDISEYPETVDGIIAFEDTLLGAS